MHLVTGGGEKQLAGMMMQAEADLDELIVAYSEVSCSQILKLHWPLPCQSHRLFRRWAKTNLVPVFDACHQVGHQVPGQNCTLSVFIAVVII